MINLSISFNKGRGNLEHNKRRLAYDLRNVDRNKSSNNIVLLDDDIHETYTKLFGQAVEKHDQKTTRKDRKIVDYYDYVKRRQDKENGTKHCQSTRLFKEFVIQIGNRKTLDQNKISDETLIKIYQKYYDNFKKRNPNLVVFGAYIHMDELTPHLHLDVIPCSKTSNTRTKMELTNSFDNALETEGYNVKKQKTAFRNWRNDEINCIESVMDEFQIAREIVGNTSSHSTNAHLDLHQKYMTQVNNFVDEQAKKVAETEQKFAPFKVKKKVGFAKTEDVEVVEKSVLDEVLKENQALKIQENQSKKSLIDITKAKNKLENRDIEKEFSLLNQEYEDLALEFKKLLKENKTIVNDVNILSSIVNKIDLYNQDFYDWIDTDTGEKIFTKDEQKVIKDVLKFYGKEFEGDWQND